MSSVSQKPSTVAEHMLQRRIHELEGQIINIRSNLTNVIANIRMAAEEQDYDEIISICEDWDPRHDAGH